MTPLRARIRRLRPRRLRRHLVATAVAALALSLTFLTIRSTSKGADWTSTGALSVFRPANGKAAAILEGPGLRGTFVYERAALLRSGRDTIAAELRLKAKTTGEARERISIAMAIVIDTSGSMSGEKIAKTREAVAALVESMRDDDRVAIVSYSSHASLLQRLDTITAARLRLPAIVESLVAGGGTNIPAGLDAGAEALRAAPPAWVRRMVLLSDGNDGSGVSLETLCDDLRRRSHEGTTLSSIGIGLDYSERYMASVADAGNGNYVFLADGSSLQGFLHRELDEASASAVDQAFAELTLPAGWSVENVYGADHEVTGQRVTLPLGVVRTQQDRRAVVEFRPPPGAGDALETPSLRIRYRTTHDNERHELKAAEIALRLVADPAEVDASVDTSVLASTGAARIEAQQAQALAAWQRGEHGLARDRAKGAVAAARSLSAKTKSAEVEELAGLLDREAHVMAAPEAPGAQKAMRAFGSARRSRARTSDTAYANEVLE